MREFFSGVGDLGRGFAYWATSPRLMLLGAVPALVVGVVWVGLLGWLWSSLDGVATAATPFADTWVDPWRTGLRLLAGLVVVVASLAVAALSFTAVVLAVGDPFYERISAAVERRLGAAPAERQEPVLRGLLRAAGEGLRLLVASLLVGALVLVVGLIPVVGAVLAAAVGALLGGWFLVVELTGAPFDARGLDLAARRRLLRTRRARTLGLGVATWVVFLVPFGAVLAMPAAVGGATVLARAILTDADATEGGAAVRAEERT